LSRPLDELRCGGKAALARALARVEAAPADEATLALLDAAWAEPRAVVVGLTGPPGVGKSTLVSALVRAWRERGRTVGVIAVDPSSKRTRGALLGDRTRIDVDPEDQGVFMRSLAARDRLGGLADLTAAVMVLMRASYDMVLVETVGVGQSESEIAELADTVVFAVQPGSGDSLQFMKAGIVEIPDVALVTKADLGGIADRAKRDLEGALGLVPGAGQWEPPVLLVSATTGRGIEAALEALDSHQAHIAGELAARRGQQARLWLRRWLHEECGRRGAARAEALLPQILADQGVSPFRWLHRAVQVLEQPQP
jgi:LAO/AO transport system kinase